MSFVTCTILTARSERGRKHDDANLCRADFSSRVETPLILRDSSFHCGRSEFVDLSDGPGGALLDGLGQGNADLVDLPVAALNTA
jgi:hypothetical protein